ncbi:hypothetical protein HNY73_006941 [Argiope bruennichi]|uniref:Uncharacterized protein n=1 Tax=Argiope bruennichi TaxID=94029 RepID=A0A8T0FCV6_ARGBR|nr:hypothetical protein HNY73_006941 [Argiope bruennichi]
MDWSDGTIIGDHSYAGAWAIQGRWVRSDGYNLWWSFYRCMGDTRTRGTVRFTIIGGHSYAGAWAIQGLWVRSELQSLGSHSYAGDGQIQGRWVVSNYLPPETCAGCCRSPQTTAGRRRPPPRPAPASVGSSTCKIFERDKISIYGYGKEKIKADLLNI